MGCFNLKSDNSERVLYDKPDYPVYIRQGRLSHFPNYTAESHWHDDIEFIRVLSGEMEYNINGEVVVLKEGEGIFVNARQFHFGYSSRKKECMFICLLLHSVLLCSSDSVEQKYINPIIFNDKIPFYHLKNENNWEKDILDAIVSIYEVRNDELSELKIQKTFFDIWISLCENIITLQKNNISQNHSLSVLKSMIFYINQNYKEKLSLEKIASSGNVGKTGCCCIFKRYINKTPIEYLTEFRLRKAMELLRGTDMTILEITYVVGFSGASYFSEIFRKYYGYSPSEYRKMLKRESAY